jgi:hypothetical protein
VLLSTILCTHMSFIINGLSSYFDFSPIFAPFDQQDHLGKLSVRQQTNTRPIPSYMTAMRLCFSE